jgi:PAS domain S-box-containing protein
VSLDFAKIFENIITPLTVAEPEHPNNLVYVNKAYCDLTGYTAEELIGTNPGKLLQKDITTSKREFIRRKLNSHESIDVLVKNYRKDGTSFWNGLHIHPVMENGKCLYWVGMAKDVSVYVDQVNEGLEAVIAVVKGFHQMTDDLKSI